MKRIFLILLTLISFFSVSFATTKELNGYRNLTWGTSLNQNFMKCTQSELYQLKQNVLACEYKYDDKTFGYINKAYVSYIFYYKKLIAVRIGIFNEILDSEIITNKYGNPYIDYGLLKTWHVGNTNIEYAAKGEIKNKITNEVVSPMFTSVTYYSNSDYEEAKNKRNSNVYNNI